MMPIRWPRLLNPTHLRQIIQCQKNPLTALHIFREAKLKYPNYRHNGPVYGTMISILGNAGRISEMKEVIEEMKADSCECRDLVFSAAIKTYAAHGLLDEAIILFRELPHFNCVNWTESFNTLLQIMIKEYKLETACNLFLESSQGWEVKSRVRSLNLLMDALCEMRRSDLALQIFQEMDYQGCYPNRESYGILMKGLCEDGRLNEATHLLYSMFWRISQKGSGEDIVIYRILLNTLCDNDQVEEAINILRKILKKGLKAPKRSLQSINLKECTRDDSQEVGVVKRLINDCLVNGGIPSSASYSAMAIDLFNENKIVDAEKVVAKMRTKGYKPLSLIYEAKLTALCKEGRVEEAREVVDEEIVKDSNVPSCKVYDIVIKGLCDHKNSKLAVVYLEKMSKKFGFNAFKETYDIVLRGLCSEGNFIDASRVLEQMVIKSHKPHADIFGMIVEGLCGVGRQYEAVMWLEEMVSRGNLPEVPVWNSLVSSVCCKISEIELVSSHSD
ncbi:pentatricopeptide repeat-containing protein At1g05600 [Punica granatum]|uniref:Pentatricopeptide repeat-containing protein At1g05600 n=1 Tax=Punica granatum TaxID=22663 RepID=A0A218XF08_PUNGR|nr:pentatricopeptide repeat-containing protein At1g05600 [Punica granatum]XP_031373899.1 pentatricopeptide repeat-containing protein At1g05600 [Punica granatum]XP_031373900.1 pentatricopeptide repeat-containing protein At1g05600 [Punica granatum]XP_031373901.1 pentatricopeptide repeat-containing protein At1g05600 [Punica granatum]OWM82932.1 hypothetical protein CDL15_Pgr005332 [Punica granatum]